MTVMKVCSATTHYTIIKHHTLHFTTVLEIITEPYGILNSTYMYIQFYFTYIFYYYKYTLTEVAWLIISNKLHMHAPMEVFSPHLHLILWTYYWDCEHCSCAHGNVHVDTSIGTAYCLLCLYLFLPVHIQYTE